jgi:putative SOS response-associated peptidase YedK
MWAASIFEEYERWEGGSFAMVTDTPPPEVAAAGQDRCPVFIDRALVDRWLLLEGQTLAQLYALLEHKQPTYFSHTHAA